ncbi:MULTISPECIES: stage II sporulation protein M [unclassified Paenibacillus]|uniref:stage II sporulation protein M n=1 Tax=unclassified Paenibacillus TaxID=185978 RepID=UPI0024077566|nr:MULTISPECIES: stage II sporulation protein M [unclassified Paenibacillus]MDF9844487.1 stage II sporulation protein M [Paenibacillus sp. PastF-2]MDF9851091.1 stage II sporulation protein M [Paenibacillus sp. PastM-2]MDF9857580.1 stage II sporulation protein M [Paenibacillus sp. PastF-1]MDH6482929.1 stage II sporulation protein M [Paenibacillus sp. PastH-2]MDH6510354.1 stage II sporulation protein M [Paenibacillus sp. PastM-3]
MFAFSRFVRDLGTIRKALLLALTLFLLGGVLGWIGTGSLQKLLAQQLEGLSSISGKLMDSDNPEWSFFTFIFLNNSIKSVAVIFLGALFGFIPAFFLLINGAVIGYLIHLSVIQGADLFQLIVKGLLPHGIIEIPAIIIACAFGLQFGGKVIQSMSGRVRGSSWAEFMRQTVTASVWIVILLLLAAIIESTITLALLS